MEKYSLEIIKKLIDEAHITLRDEWANESNIISSQVACNTALAMMQFNELIDKEKESGINWLNAKIVFPDGTENEL